MDPLPPHNGRPSRQYVFRARHDRRRIAQRLAAAGPERVAAEERTTAARIALLLADASFARLVEHYRVIQELSAEERLVRLTGMALELLELALEAGDVRAAAFVLDERRQGRNPAASLAEGLAQALDRRCAAGGMPPPQPLGRARGWLSPATQESGQEASSTHSSVLTGEGGGKGTGGDEDESRAPAGARAASTIPPRREADFPFCAATLPDPGAAERLALEAACALDGQLQVTAARLRQQLLGEMERLGTAVEPAAVLRGFARAAHAAPASGMRAATRLAALHDRDHAALDSADRLRPERSAAAWLPRDGPGTI